MNLAVVRSAPRPFPFGFRGVDRIDVVDHPRDQVRGIETGGIIGSRTRINIGDRIGAPVARRGEDIAVEGLVDLQRREYRPGAEDGADRRLPPIEPFEHGFAGHQLLSARRAAGADARAQQPQADNQPPQRRANFGRAPGRRPSTETLVCPPAHAVGPGLPLTTACEAAHPSRATASPCRWSLTPKRESPSSTTHPIPSEFYIWKVFPRLVKLAR